MIYLDNAATTKPSKEVVQDIVWCLENVWGNPSSIHSEGIKAKRILEESREKVAKFINAEPDEMIFTASGSEANNLAIKGFMDGNNHFNCIITTKIEHPSVYNTCCRLGKKYMVEYAPIDFNGRVDVKRFETLMSVLSERHTCFVSIMLANNEIGAVQPINKIADIVHKYNGVLHVDATQAIGQISVDVNELGCDLLTFSSHKVGCPRGVGVLYKKKGIRLSPIVVGGHQENDYHAGTENVAMIYALGNQLERLGKQGFPTPDLRNALICKVCDCCEDVPIFVNGDPLYILPNIISFTFGGINAEALMTLLDMKGVCVSTGSACSSGEAIPSRVLKAIGLSDEEALSTVRISLGHNTTEAECDEFVKALVECVRSLKMME